jgi:hypothetical protein
MMGTQARKDDALTKRALARCKPPGFNPRGEALVGLSQKYLLAVYPIM